MMDTIYLNGIGILAPGFNGWNNTRSILRGEAQYDANQTSDIAVSLMSPREKRRANKTSLLAVHLAEEAIQHADIAPDTLIPVFSSFSGDLQITDKLCTSLADDDPIISAFLFHNSVQNAPAGYWSIATHSTNPSTSIACGCYSFHAAFLEAASVLSTEKKDVLLAVYDLDTPYPLCTQCRADAACGVAMVLSNTNTHQTIAALAVSLTNEITEPYQHSNDEINNLIQKNTSLHAISLLDPIANQYSGKISLNFLDSMSIIITHLNPQNINLINSCDSSREHLTRS